MAELLDSIKVIGEGLNAINFQLSNLSVVTDEFKKLKVERNRVRERFDILVDYFFENNTKRYIEADSQLAVVNKEMQATLDDLQNFQNTLNNVRRFVSAIDTFITSIMV